MKVKLDHVTNSSSCSYVFCVPKDFDLRAYINQKLGPEEVDDEIKKLIEKSGKGFIYYFHYSDNDGENWSDMEHGGTFDELPYIQISHH